MEMENIIRHPNVKYYAKCSVVLIAFVLLVHLYSKNESSSSIYRAHPFKQLPVTESVLASQNEVGSIRDDHNIKSDEDNDILDIEFIENNLYSLDQSDKGLIQYTRIRYLTPPSKLPYNLKVTEDNKDQFSGWVASFFENKTNGIFIEAGANLGERGSHTLYLEKEFDWKGLLIECNPTTVPYLVSHHRKAWVASVCLAPSNKPGKLNFSKPTNWTYSGAVERVWNLPAPTKWTFFYVETIPLYTILTALNWKEVDYFKFDIEGYELAVLKSFPFDKIIFKVLIIQTYLCSSDERIELDKLLLSNDYHFVRKMQTDKIYVHQSVKHLLNL